MLLIRGIAERTRREVGALAKELGLRVIALGDRAPLVVETSGGELAGDPAAAAARALAITKPGDWILLKASRGMKLERVLAALKERA